MASDDNSKGEDLHISRIGEHVPRPQDVSHAVSLLSLLESDARLVVQRVGDLCRVRLQRCPSPSSALSAADTMVSGSSPVQKDLQDSCGSVLSFRKGQASVSKAEKAAVARDGHWPGTERCVTVRQYAPSSPETFKIHIRYPLLNWCVSQEELMSVFSSCGSILGCSMETGRPLANMTFGKHSELETALSLDKTFWPGSSERFFVRKWRSREELSLSIESEGSREVDVIATKVYVTGVNGLHLEDLPAVQSALEEATNLAIKHITMTRGATSQQGGSMQLAFFKQRDAVEAVRMLHGLPFRHSRLVAKPWLRQTF